MYDPLFMVLFFILIISCQSFKLEKVELTFKKNMV